MLDILHYSPIISIKSQSRRTVSALKPILSDFNLEVKFLIKFYVNFSYQKRDLIWERILGDELSLKIPLSKNRLQIHQSSR